MDQADNNKNADIIKQIEKEDTKNHNLYLLCLFISRKKEQKSKEYHHFDQSRTLQVDIHGNNCILVVDKDHSIFGITSKQLCCISNTLKNSCKRIDKIWFDIRDEIYHKKKGTDTSREKRKKGEVSSMKYGQKIKPSNK